MTWMKFDINLEQHPKTQRLARILKISLPTTIGHLFMLWTWSLKYAEDGDLKKYEAADIANGIHWDGDPEMLISAFKETSFIDDDDRIHDWEGHQGALLELRKANALREKERRARNKAHVSHVDDTCEAREEKSRQDKKDKNKEE
ncbi:MAG: hypothetical protein M1455_10255 [Actinobacteria bacterium]|nr:hypothetical protein [Actinomycetota bacterium]